MEFVDGGKQIFFQGDPHSVDVKLSKSGLRRLIARGVPNYFFHLRSEDPTSEEVKLWFEMIEVLKELDDVFEEPQKFPQYQTTNQ